MKKLLLPILLLASSLNAKLMFRPETDTYYSTNLTPDLNSIKYDTLAKYAVRMIDVAYREEVGIIYIITHLKDVLMADGSKEADILYDDLVEVWG